MLRALETRKDVVVAVGNERLWSEQTGGAWLNTGKTIWPARDGVEDFDCRVVDKCGLAKICNSSMVFRTAGAEALQTPNSIPIDVTEHYREQVIPHPILLVRRPLVNYGDTLVTHRSRGYKLISQHLILLVGSVFRLARERDRSDLAAALWQRARAQHPLSKTNLLSTALVIREARVLWSYATAAEKLRFFASVVRRPIRMWYGIGRPPTTRRRGTFCIAVGLPNLSTMAVPLFAQGQI